ncbi:hypothetical protein S83_019384 [Arachis hypogaea]
MHITRVKRHVRSVVSVGSKRDKEDTMTLSVPTTSDSQRNPADNNNNNGDKSSRDWDKAWSNFKKQGKKSLFSGFSPDKYVSWNPRRSEFPISEEVDPIKRTERSNLKFWNSPTFTLGGAVIIVLFLLLYTILAPIK